MDDKKINISIGNILKVVGLVLMLVDHIGHFLFPEIIILRIVGRIAYPCFLYGVVKGVGYTKNIYKYAFRMALMGLISIISWGYLLPLNIGFSLALLILGIHAYQEGHPLIAITLGMFAPFVEYGIYGYLFGMLFFLWDAHEIPHEAFIVSMILLHGWNAYYNSMIQAFAVLFFAVLVFVQYVVRRGYRVERLPKIFGYLFYPAHVFILRMFSLFIL